jgi:4a-hydroxytetrahydrobiopterin dehydratase
MNSFTKNIKSVLKSELKDWELKNNKLHRSLKFQNFTQAFAFMSATALEAEKRNHHPNWSNVYNNVDIQLFTHDENAVTEKDLDLALKIEELASIFLSK